MKPLFDIRLINSSITSGFLKSDPSRLSCSLRGYGLLGLITSLQRSYECILIGTRRQQVRRICVLMSLINPQLEAAGNGQRVYS